MYIGKQTFNTNDRQYKIYICFVYKHKTYTFKGLTCLKYLYKHNYGKKVFSNNRRSFIYTTNTIYTLYHCLG